MGHVYNGDMVSTTLLQGLMNTFVFWLSMLAARQFDDRPMIAFAVSMTLQVALSFLALIPITWFSRRREYAADRFAAEQYGVAGMMSLLRRRVSANTQDDCCGPLAALATFGQSRGLLAGHPTLEQRIAALQSKDPAR